MTQFGKKLPVKLHRPERLATFAFAFIYLYLITLNNMQPDET